MELGRTIKFSLLFVLILLSVQAFGSNEGYDLDDPIASYWLQGIEPQILTGVLNPQSISSGSWYEAQAIGFGLGSANPCSSGTTTTCTYTILPTTANSALAVAAVTTNNITISSVSGCGGTWHVGLGGHVFDASVGNVDTAYNVTNTGGCTSLTVTMSGAPGTAIWPGIVLEPIEFIPPAGSTALLDQVSTVDNATCSTCNLASFSSGTALTATDAVVQWNVSTATMTSCVDSAGTSSDCASTYSSPYLIDYNGNAIALNVASGSLTGTGKQRNPSGSLSGIATFSGMAFKSSAGSFTVLPAKIWTPTTSSFFTQTGVTCSPTCALTIPSTIGSDLLALCAQTQTGAGASAFINSISGGGTWVIPSGANTVQIGKASFGSSSCAYVLSDTASVTTITPNMNASGQTYYFGVYELHKSTGAAVFDVQGSTDNSGTSTSTPSGQALTLSGTDDACFQIIQMPSASSGLWAVTQVPYSYNAWTNTNGQNLDSGNTAGAVGYTLNVASVPTPTWITYNAVAAGSLVAGMCFK